MSTYTEFGKLKEIIVWNVQNYNLDKLDITFKIAYWENMKESTFGDYVDYKVDKQKIIERTEDLNNFAKLLEENGVKVVRPDELQSFQSFKTPKFSGFLTPVSNPRDKVIVLGNKIIETPALCSKRYFENQLLYKLFQEYFNKWYTWLSAPMPPLTRERFDEWYWLDKRDFKKFDMNAYDIAFDAAHMIKIGKDILFNVSSYNHELWARWMQNFLWDDFNIHKVYQLDDTHIDGKISVLRPGTFLVNNSMMDKNIKSYLPEKFHSWDFIFTADDREYPPDYVNSGTNFIELCSLRGSDTNVLSLDENTVCVIEDAIETIKELEKRDFKVIAVKMRHNEIFWGGLHCATLDIDREDELIDYTK